MEIFNFSESTFKLIVVFAVSLSGVTSISLRIVNTQENIFSVMQLSSYIVAQHSKGRFQYTKEPNKGYEATLGMICIYICIHR